MPYLDLTMRVLHIFGASILVGAMVFMLLAYLPAVRKLEEERRRDVFAALRPKWAMLVGIGTALLLVSGLYNTAMISIGYELPSLYHILLGVKIVLALVVFLLAALVSGRSGAAAAMQQKLGMWLGITLLLLLATMSVAAFMKTIERAKKDKTSTESSQVAPLYPARG